VILTLGRSHALLQFLLEAKKKRSFEVFVAEGAPRYHSDNLYAYSQFSVEEVSPIFVFDFQVSGANIGKGIGRFEFTYNSYP
jgi:translation initiation factor 2B subunit (eIF-2B alpha/beta/delta family)